MSDQPSVIPSTDDSDEIVNQANRSLEVARLRNATLAGATEAITFASVHDLRLAVMTIMTCDRHGGVHHFAIGGFGQQEASTLFASRSAFECINAANLGFTIDGYDAPEKPAVEPGYHDASVATPRDRCPKCGGVEIAPFKYDHDTDCPNN